MPRPWLKVEPAVVKHPKTRALARLWQCHPYEVVGFLVALWGYFLEYQPDGRLDRCPLDVLDELAAPCLGRALGTVPNVRDALLDVGFLDADGQLHDWDDYSGGIVAHRANDRKRKKLARQAAARKSDGHPAPPLGEVRGTSTPRVEQSRVEQSRVVEQQQPAAALDYPTRCVLAVNRVLEQRLAGAFKSLTATVDGDVAGEWAALGIPIELVERELAAATERYSGRNGRQPNSLRYFDGAIREAWAREQAHEAGPLLTDADRMRLARERLERETVA